MKFLFYCCLGLTCVSSLGLADDNWEGKSHQGVKAYKDKQTGITWGGLSTAYYTWADAQRACKNLAKGWSLPSKDDYEKAIKDGLVKAVPSLSTEAKGGVTYWTSTPVSAKNADLVYVYYFVNSKPTIQERDTESDGGQVVYPVICISK